MKKWLIVIVLACAQFVMVLDSTVMNVSITTVVKDLNTTVSGLQAAITFYTLTMAALMMTGGKLGDIWGRLRAFRIGSIVYGVGSMITALSPTLPWLFFGWSIVEGLGAVLVIPAIAAIIAMNYKGKDRVVGYTLIGAASGVAVAAGPLIGGFMTTYLSWRYVFAAETVVMVGVLLFSLSMHEKKAENSQKVKIDLPSVLLSASGMTLLVFGILQSKTWGWVMPKATPEISGHAIAPLGISIVTYLIIAGMLVLKLFVSRQRKLMEAKSNPLLDVSMLNIKPLRSGLAVLSGQYLVTAAIFFVMPIYLQMVLGYDALETGVRIVPLSISIVLFAGIGSRLSGKFSPKQIVRAGQWSLLAGSIVLLAAINPEMKGFIFGSGMFIVGIGLGLLASQIGNVTMSAVKESQTSEVGGLQGTFQNLGASLGTAIIGSVMIASLTTGFTNAISQNNDIPASVKQSVEVNAEAGIPITSSVQVKEYALDAGLSESEATSISDDYANSQMKSLKFSMLFLVVIAIGSLALSRNIPNKKLV